MTCIRRGSVTKIGNTFRDGLSGGAGNNSLTGGAGNDVLSGGQGDDRFVFSAGFGADVITDFAAGAASGDIIAFALGMFASIEALMSSARQVIRLAGTTRTTDVVITYDAAPLDPGNALDTLTLRNLTLAKLTAEDFSFV